jgi:hypothetical protein
MAGEFDQLSENIESVDKKVDQILDYLSSMPSNDREKKDKRTDITSLFEKREDEQKLEKNRFNRLYKKEKLYQAIPITLDSLTPDGKRDLSKIFQGILPTPIEPKLESKKDSIPWADILKWAALLLPLLSLLNKNIRDLLSGLLKGIKGVDVTKAIAEGIKAKQAAKLPKATAEDIKAKQETKLSKATNTAKLLDEISKAGIDTEKISKFFDKYNKLATGIENNAKAAEELTKDLERLGKRVNASGARVRSLVEDGAKDTEEYLKATEEYAKATKAYTKTTEEIDKINKATELSRNSLVNSLIDIVKPESEIVKQVDASIKNIKFTPKELEVFDELAKTRYLETMQAIAKYGYSPESKEFKALTSSIKLTPAEQEAISKLISERYGSILRAGFAPDSPVLKMLSEAKLSKEDAELLSKAILAEANELLFTSLKAQQKIITDLVQQGYTPSKVVLKALTTDGDDLLIRLATQRYQTLIRSGFDPQSEIFQKLLTDVKLGDAETSRIQQLVRNLDMELISKDLDYLKVNLSKAIDSFAKGTDWEKIWNELIRLKELGLTPEEIKNLKPTIEAATSTAKVSFFQEILTAIKEAPEATWNGFKDIIKNDILTPQEYEKLAAPARAAMRKVNEVIGNYFTSAEKLQEVEKIATEAAETAVKTPGFMEDLRNILKPFTGTALGRMAGRLFVGLGVAISTKENLDWYQTEIDRIAKEKVQNPDQESKIAATTAITTWLINTAGWFNHSLWGLLATFLKPEDFKATITQIFNNAKQDPAKQNQLYNVQDAATALGAPMDVFVKGAGEMCAQIFGDLLGWISDKVFKSQFWKQYFDDATAEFREKIKQFSLADWLLKAIGYGTSQTESTPSIKNSTSGISEDDLAKTPPKKQKDDLAKTPPKKQNDFVMRPGRAPVSFSENDTIVGVKDISKLTETPEETFKILDRAVKSMTKTTQDSSKLMINELKDSRIATQKMSDNFRKLSDDLIANTKSVNMINNSRSLTNITISPTTSKSYRDSRFCA